MTSGPSAGEMLTPSRAAGWRGVTLGVLGFVALLLVEVAVLGVFPHLATNLANASDGLLSVSLCFSLVLLVIEAFLLFGRLHLRPGDVGLIRSRVAVGVLIYAIAWLCYQALFVVLGVLGQGRIELASFWRQPSSYPAIVGTFLTFTVGVALSEEILFRGFLVPQTWQTLRGLGQPWVRLGVTLAISQGIFAVLHVPAVLSEGLGLLGILQRLGGIFLLGTLLALVWLQARNLFIAVAVHGLADGAIPLVHQTLLGDTSWLAFGMVIVLLVLWPLITRRSGLRSVLTRRSPMESMPIRHDLSPSARV